MESELSKLAGVYATEVGYTGGQSNNPSYEQVCSGKTGHTEAVKIEFNEAKLSYKSLLRSFLELHNPFSDTSSVHNGQYKSVIFYANSSQKEQAKEVINAFQIEKKRKVFTQLEPMGKFWRAEEYHQQYYKKSGFGFCGKF